VVKNIFEVVVQFFGSQYMWNSTDSALMCPVNWSCCVLILTV